MKHTIVGTNINLTGTNINHRGTRKPVRGTRINLIRGTRIPAATAANSQQPASSSHQPAADSQQPLASSQQPATLPATTIRGTRINSAKNKNQPSEERESTLPDKNKPFEEHDSTLKAARPKARAPGRAPGNKHQPQTCF